MFFKTSQQFYGSSGCSTGDVVYGPISMGIGLAPGGPYALGVNSYRRWLFTGLVLKAGEYIRFFNSNNFTNLVFEKVGPFSGDWDTGCANFTSQYQTQHFYSIPDLGCSKNSDCPDGKKCVNGVCVPCEKLVDGKGIVTLWGVKMSDGTIMSDGLPVDISSGVAAVQLSNFDPSYLTAGRIQISNGMSGTLTVKAGIGVLGSDFGANVTLFSGAVSGHYQDFIFDSGNIPFGYTFNGKVTFEILNYDTLGDCADDDVDDTPVDPPIDIVDGGEPQPPGGSGPGTVTPPGGTNTIIKIIV